MIFKKQNVVRYFAHNTLIVVGLVLMWRGVWYVLDEIDLLLFDGHHLYTALLGIAFGLFVLYAPDKDLKEISKL